MGATWYANDVLLLDMVLLKWLHETGKISENHLITHIIRIRKNDMTVTFQSWSSWEERIKLVPQCLVLVFSNRIEFKDMFIIFKIFSSL